VRRVIELQWVKTADMRADFLTKPLGRLALAKGRAAVGLQPFSAHDSSTA
jgi:hypothetical protein